jgi:hypothetical protein
LRTKGVVDNFINLLIKLIQKYGKTTKQF